MWPIKKKKNAACLHVHCVSRKKTEQQNSGIAVNSLSALFSLILDSLLTACSALFSFWLSFSSCSYKNSCRHPGLSFSVTLPLLESVFLSPFISSYNAFHTAKCCLSPPPLNMEEKITRSPVSPWQATAIPSSLLLMIINYMSLTNMPRAILPHLSCAIDFTFWIHAN